ncbi:sigma-70 family RNA polymerase sigma factor [Rudaeicoccus suwonensis]|uniref:RNA polymerase sigma-70 factor (ECF subfamily) n=1 Tax=Rudaeicoccus suwonensis TaxID=657409 RepID=A0A561E462_9MICO|nr:sigma-70 family RNA polymerase sigma factor [Rudaeicoccus suwonensis]TWE10398.1 RNA polymerase sigma-70 factor (ECF subfamily) [Rudaeicoccus suwonensis]
MDDQTRRFEAERPRLTRIAERLLGDHAEAEDIVQNAWMRLARNEIDIENLPAWLTTVTTRLCLDRLRSKQPETASDLEPDEVAPDPADQIVLADAVGDALHLVLERLNPSERVAFVLHDSFTVDFATIAEILDVSPAAARKLGSRARTKLAATQDIPSTPTDATVIDAFLRAAKGGDLDTLVMLLAPQVVLEGADDAARAMGTPRLAGRSQVARLLNGGAKTAFPVFIGERPGAAWLHRGQFKVAFEFTVEDGVVCRIDLRADPTVLAAVHRRT